MSAPEPTVRATRYEVSCLPLDHELALSARISVEWRGGDRYAVLDRCGRALGTDGEWDYELMPSSRTDEWKDSHRFDLGEALRLAREAAPKITVRGRTAAEWLADEQNEVTTRG